MQKKSIKSKKKSPNQLKKRTRWLKLIFQTAVIGMFALIGIFACYSYDLPDIRSLENSERKPSITMVTKDGELLTTYGDLYGNTITLDKIPSYVPKAVLAIEDHRFYNHIGIDVVAFSRALFNNLIKGKVVQGGSSISQQLAKNFLLAKKKFHYSDRSLRRKVQELLVALWLEYHFTKDQILSIYLNRIDFGAGVYGFDAAAQRYFFKPLNDVSVFEAAILAGMLKAPTRFNPLRHPAESAKRGTTVIHKMIEYGWISESKGKAEIQTGTKKLLNRRIDTAGYRYFTDWIMDTLPSYLGYLDRDLIVVTTLDLKAQDAANRTIQAMVKQHGEKLGFKQMALISINTDGEVLAMVGGLDYGRSQFNRVTQALRQPGSAFKPFVYMAAFEKDFKPTDIMNDAQQAYGKWKPKNIYDQYRGDLTLEEALAYSSNTIAVKLLHEIGVGSLIKLARRLGIHTKLSRNLTLALGSGEVTLFDLTAAYGVIANQGYELYPHGVVEIRDRTTNELLYKSGLPEQKKLLAEQVVLSIDQLLTAAVNYGTSKRSRLNHEIPSAAKSGTSQGYRDSWCIGYVKHRKGPITGIWLGNDDNIPTKGVVGGTIPAESWKMYHDLWVSPLPEDQHIFSKVPPVEEVIPLEEEEGLPQAEGTLEDIYEALESVNKTVPEDMEITPESLEHDKEFDHEY